MPSVHPPLRLITTLLVLLAFGAAPAAEYRNFKLPCLAPLLRKVDSEAPTSLNVAFLRGPWRAPPLRNDIGVVDFQITTKSNDAAVWFNQGIALLHGQANAEAERNFRQALLFDPENPMIFWGLAIANEQRPGRARLFAQNAVRRVNNDTTAREKLWIKVLGDFYDLDRNGPAKLPPARKLTPEEERLRIRQRIRNLEAITLAHPSDLEAKAFLLRQLVLDLHRSEIPISSYVAVDRLARELAALAPDHPSLHYRLFLWLNERPEQSLLAAQGSALLAPGLADSWRFSAEAWRANGQLHHAVAFLESALRVHHRELRDQLTMPHQLENLTSNYAALIESLGRAGRIEEALSRAEQFLAFPRPLVSSTWDGSPLEDTFVGRRLFAQTLLRAEMPQRLLNELAANTLLQPNPISRGERAQILYWRGLALATLGKFKELAAVEENLLTIERLPSPNLAHLGAIKDAARGLSSYRKLCLNENPDEHEPAHLPANILAQAWQKAGRTDLALKIARRDYEEHPGALLSSASFCELSFAANDPVPAMQTLSRPFRQDALRADKDLPALTRLAPVATRMNLPRNWKLPSPAIEAPTLPSDPTKLGPATWTPPAAPDWTLPNHTGRNIALKDFRGRALLLNFFLGVSCPFCVNQLDTFRPQLDAFAKAGITMVAISTDDVKTLATRLGDTEEKTEEARTKFPYLILADPKLETFKNYHVFDDFEDGPMHATFLLSPQGKILWSDIGHEPFNQPGPLLAEAKRLLKLHATPED